jgi:ubiquitin-protein ligase E3 C
LFKFFGMVVGKALFEGTLLKCNFAKFFLNKFVDKSNSVDDLKTLDPDLYNNLMYLKYYEVSSSFSYCL